VSSDDTSTLFESDPNQPPPLALRQGTVQSWNADTGENEVQYGGGVLANLPALASESASLAAGDVVSLLVTNDRVLVLGKVITPGDPGTVPTWNADITALTPLVDIAAVTDGTTMTGIGVQDSIVTGSLIRTAESGRRWEIDSPTSANEIRGYTGGADEVAPAILQVSAGELAISGPDRGAGKASIELDATTGDNSMFLTADNGVFLQGEGPAGTTKVWASPDGAVLSSSAQTHQVWADGAGVVMIVTDSAGVVHLESDAGGIELVTNGGGIVTVNGEMAAVVGPYWYGYLSASQLIQNNTPTPVTGWVADGTPNNSEITFSAGNFTIPRDGRYRLRTQCWWGAQAGPAGARSAFWIKVSPATALASHTAVPSALAAHPNNIDKTVRLSAGDQVFVRVLQTQGAAINLVGSNPDISYVQIEWVGP
jgi:hypothetical protein